MVFPYTSDPEDLHWWEIVSNHPELIEGLDELGADPEAGVVAAVGIFTVLKLRFWHQLPSAVSETVIQEHQSDESVPPGEAQTS